MLISIIKILAALFVVALNAFFVVSEFALVKVRRTRLEELANAGHRRAKAALHIVKSMDSYLSAIQLGITLTSLTLGWLGESALSHLITPLLNKFMIHNPILIQSISIAIAFGIITFLHVVFGELVPKSVAIQKSEQVVLNIAYPMLVFYKVTYPLVYIFDKIAERVLRLMGMVRGEDTEQAHSEEELRMIVNASHSGGILNDTEGAILDNVFTFADKDAGDLMVPRMEMVCLYLDESYEENMNVILSSSFTRFPLCRSDKDNIVGMIHLRDMLENETRAEPCTDLEKLMRSVLFVPETLNVSEVMQRMRRKRIHLAVVIDEYGGTAGLVSLEDILEEIVGDIDDEHDVASDPEVQEIAPNLYILSGLMLQGDVEELLNIDLGDQDDDTIGGFVFSVLGRKPETSDTIVRSGFVFEVAEIDGLRIDKLKVYPAYSPLVY